MSIQEHLNKIRNAVYGREVRESIAKGIETAYDDASEKDNANMEVKIARGTNPNLNTRLNKMDETDSQNTEKIDSNYNEVTAQLEQTQQEVERKRELEDLSSSVLSAIEGGQGTSFNLLSVPQDKSVTPIKRSGAFAPAKRDLSPYTSTAAETTLFIENKEIDKGLVSIMGKFDEGTVTFVLLEQVEPLRFKLVDSHTQGVTSGEHLLEHIFYSTGINQKIGVMGSIKFSTTGGQGYVETPDYDFSSELTSRDKLSSTTDFAYYPIYEKALGIEMMTNEVESVKKQLPEAGNSDYLNFDSFLSLSQDYLFFRNKPLERGTVTIHSKNPSGVGRVYIARLSGNNAEIVFAKDHTFTEGENVIPTDYIAKGDGSEFIGIDGVTYYNVVAEEGYYQVMYPLTYAVGDTVTLENRLHATTSFAMYATYEGENVSESLDRLESSIEELKNETPSYSSVKLSDFLMPKYQEIEQHVGFMGRWFDVQTDNGLRKGTINSGSELYFKVKGTTEVMVNFDINHSYETPVFAYSINGKPFVRQLITNPTITLENTNEVIIRVIIDGLTESENKWVGEKGILFKDITVGAGGVVTGLYPRNKVGMYFGDSITEGIAILEQGNNRPSGNSIVKSYGHISSQKLNAIMYCVGFGGTGLTKGGSGGIPNVNVVIDNMTQAKEAPYFLPDYIVVNHGTNDGAATSGDFSIAYNLMLDRLSVKYPGVPIFAMIPFNQRHAQVITDSVLNRKSVFLIKTTGWGVTYVDGTHPDVQGGEVGGVKLAEAIEQTLGKDFFLS